MANEQKQNDGAQEAKNAWDAKELGVLWTKVKNGGTERYLTGVINLKNLGFDKDVSVVVFSNKTKKKDTHPDLRIYLSERRDASAAPAKTTQARPTRAVVQAEPELPEPQDQVVL